METQQTEAQRVDTQRAYTCIREKIITLELPPGAAINDQGLAGELGLALASVQEALKLLDHDHLVRITPRHGTYVADINLPDLEQISQLRLALESLAAELAAQHATPDDLAVLDAIRDEQQSARLSEGLNFAGHEHAADASRLFDIDHKFHRAVAAAAHNAYLAEMLDHLFGLSQRFWYLMLPPGRDRPSPPEFLSEAVGTHLHLVEAIRNGAAKSARQIMSDHVDRFYREVRVALAERDRAAG